jgi:hypothetical protein
MKKTRIAFLAILTIMVGLSNWACEGPAGKDGAAGADGADGIGGSYLAVSPVLASVARGSSVTVTAVTKNGTDASYTWATSDPNVASVSGGDITGISVGTAIVAVVGDNTGAGASVIVSVTEQMRTAYDYSLDINPMFTSDDFWFAGSDACTWCHYANDEEALHSKHVMDLGTFEGMMYGADPDPDNLAGSGHPLWGESETGKTDYDWDNAMMKSRLRNNRMPQAPGWEFLRDESNRLGPDLEFVSGRASVIRPIKYSSWDDPDAVPNALGLIEAWVTALKASGDIGAAGATMTFTYGGQSDLTFNDDVLQFFSEANMWFNNSTSCVECHWGNIDESYHLMDLSDYAGFIYGADGGEHPVLNGTKTGLTSATDIDWGSSRLKHRLRDNRMPPNSPFLLSEENRDGPDVWDPVLGEMTTAVELIGRWLAAGAPH